jgi:hypothetical protein
LHHLWVTSFFSVFRLGVHIKLLNCSFNQHIDHKGLFGPEVPYDSDESAIRVISMLGLFLFWHYFRGQFRSMPFDPMVFSYVPCTLLPKICLIYRACHTYHACMWLNSTTEMVFVQRFPLNKHDYAWR